GPPPLLQPAVLAHVEGDRRRVEGTGVGGERVRVMVDQGTVSGQAVCRPPLEAQPAVVGAPPASLAEAADSSSMAASSPPSSPRMDPMRATSPGRFDRSHARNSRPATIHPAFT